VRLPRFVPDELDADQAALYSEIAEGPRASGPQHFALTADDGSLNGPFNAFLLAPGIARPLQALGAAVRYETQLTARERELAILIVAAHWNSTFEQHAHEAVGRAAGLTENELAEVRAGDIPTLADAREQAVASTVFALSHGDLDDEQWKVDLERSTIFELSTLVGYYATLALQLRIFRVDERPAQ
jgi:4-carboxymuconolactone decarboxylase